MASLSLWLEPLATRYMAAKEEQDAPKKEQKKQRKRDEANIDITQSQSIKILKQEIDVKV